MYYMRLSIDKRFLKAYQSITNAQGDPFIMQRLSAASYDASRLATGMALYETAWVLHQQLQEAKGGEAGAKQTFEAQWEAMRKVYNVHLKRARHVFEEDEGTLTLLDAIGTRPTGFGEWLGRARKFYEGLLGHDALVAQMETYGVPKAALQAAMAQLEALMAASGTRQQKEGGRQNVISQRKIALKEMDHWVIRYHRLAAQVLADQPQLLEKLGIVVRS